MARTITVNKLFAAVMTTGPDSGKRVLISPLETGNVEFLNQTQLSELAGSGSITVEETGVPAARVTTTPTKE